MLQSLPADFLTTMEEYVRDAPKSLDTAAAAGPTGGSCECCGLDAWEGAGITGRLRGSKPGCSARVIWLAARPPLLLPGEAPHPMPLQSCRVVWAFMLKHCVCMCLQLHPLRRCALRPSFARVAPPHPPSQVGWPAAFLPLQRSTCEVCSKSQTGMQRLAFAASTPSLCAVVTPWAQQHGTVKQKLKSCTHSCPRTGSPAAGGSTGSALPPAIPATVQGVLKIGPPAGSAPAVAPQPSIDLLGDDFTAAVNVSPPAPAAPAAAPATAAFGSPPQQQAAGAPAYPPAQPGYMSQQPAGYPPQQPPAGYPQQHAPGYPQPQAPPAAGAPYGFAQSASFPATGGAAPFTPAFGPSASFAAPAGGFGGAPTFPAPAKQPAPYGAPNPAHAPEQPWGAPAFPSQPAGVQSPPQPQQQAAPAAAGFGFEEQPAFGGGAPAAAQQFNPFGGAAAVQSPPHPAAPPAAAPTNPFGSNPWGAPAPVPAAAAPAANNPFGGPAPGYGAPAAPPAPYAMPTGAAPANPFGGPVAAGGAGNAFGAAPVGWSVPAQGAPAWGAGSQTMRKTQVCDSVDMVAVPVFVSHSVVRHHILRPTWRITACGC